MKALLPALFLGILTFWSGTFAGGATASGAISAHIVVLSFCLVGSARWRDPLGLGRHGRWLLPALFAVVAASWWLSPVPRAGVVGVLLLPAFLLVPAAVAACWGSPRQRRLGLAALGVLVGVVALTALERWQVQGSPRAAMPLGHHNLLATWLVILWPIGFVALASKGVQRIVLALATVPALTALAATGSFLASLAFSLQAVVAAVLWKQARLWLAVAVLALWLGPELVRQAPALLAGEPAASETNALTPRPPSGVQRAARVAAQTDSSTRARTVYARAGWLGFRERPLLGWGVGSVPWTIARFVRPVRGLNPPSEVIGDLHAWPVQLAYEIGAPGVATVSAIVLLFAWRRRRVATQGSHTAVHQAALVGLSGGAIMLLGNAPMQVLALPAALAVSTGAVLAAEPAKPRERSRTLFLLGLLYVSLTAVVLLPVERAHHLYERAVDAADEALALAYVARASEIDPDFPLYRARAAWLRAELNGVDSDSADEAHEAATRGHDLAPLWLAAGALGLEAGRPWAPEALQRARELDPLSPLPTFHLVRAWPESPDAVELAVVALTGDRRLGAAVFWEEYPELRVAVATRIANGAPDVGAMLTAEGAGPTVLLAQSMDTRRALSFSLFAFRRSPWPVDFAPVELRSSQLTAEAGH